MSALIAFAAWIAFNAALVGFLVWRGYCRGKHRRIRRAKREAIYSNYRSIENTH